MLTVIKRTVRLSNECCRVHTLFQIVNPRFSKFSRENSRANVEKGTLLGKCPLKINT